MTETQDALNDPDRYRKRAKDSALLTPLRAPRERTVRELFAMSMNRCAFPGCDVAMADPATKTIVGEICHINAASEGGPRYDPTQGDNERHAHGNLILMCSMHHKIIDAIENLGEFSAEHLRALTRKHEQNAAAAAARDLALTDLALLTIKKVNKFEFSSAQISPQALDATVSESGLPYLLDGVRADGEDVGLLDKLSDAELGMESITNLTNAIHAITEELSRIVASGSERTRASSGSQLSTSTKLAVANQMAVQFQSPADRLRVLANEFAQNVGKIEPGIAYLFDRMAQDDGDLTAGQGFVSSFETLTAAATSFAERLKRQAPMMLPLLNITQAFSRPVKSLMNSFDILHAACKKVANWNVHITNLRRLS